VINDPTDIEKNGQGNEAGAQRNEKGDGLAAAGDAHCLAILVHTRGVCTNAVLGRALSLYLITIGTSGLVARDTEPHGWSG
jgi:hypothetical protein